MNKRSIVLYALLLVILCLYLIELLTLGYAIPCVFHLVTGLKCPGCGVTRLLVSLSHFDFKSAFHYNAFVFITSPLLLYFFIKSMLNNCGVIKNQITSTENRILYVYIVLFVIFGIVRNIGVVWIMADFLFCVSRWRIIGSNIDLMAVLLFRYKAIVTNRHCQKGYRYERYEKMYGFSGIPTLLSVWERSD